MGLTFSGLLVTLALLSPARALFAQEATPTPTVPLITSLDQVTAPVATDAPHQRNQLYLPAVQDGSATLVAASLRQLTERLYLPMAQVSSSTLAETTATGASAIPYHLYMPLSSANP